MKQISKLYLFFTSLFFLFSPFSLGLVFIYFEDTNISYESAGMFINIVLVLILVTIIGALYYKEKIEMPKKEELKYLIFGLLSNVIMYFYVFQEYLNIEKFMTIYFTIIIVLLLFMLIIDHKKLNYELWILAVLFFIVDFIHFEYIFYNWNELLSDTLNEANHIAATFIQRVFFSIVPLAVLALFIVKIKLYKVIDTFAIIIIAIAVLTLSIYFGVDTEGKFLLTLNLIIPFVIVTDFIISKIYKRFNLYKIPFYIRMITIIILLYIYHGEDYFIMDSYSDHGLYELIMITYVVVICNLIEFLIPKQPIAINIK